MKKNYRRLLFALFMTALLTGCKKQTEEVEIDLPEFNAETTASAETSFEDVLEEETEEWILQEDVYDGDESGLSLNEKEKLRKSSEEFMEKFFKDFCSTNDKDKKSYTKVLKSYLLDDPETEAYPVGNGYEVLTGTNTKLEYKGLETLKIYFVIGDVYTQSTFTGLMKAHMTSDKCEEGDYDIQFTVTMADIGNGWEIFYLTINDVFKQDGNVKAYRRYDNSMIDVTGSKVLAFDFINPEGFITDYQYDEDYSEFETYEPVEVEVEND